MSSAGDALDEGVEVTGAARVPLLLAEVAAHAARGARDVEAVVEAALAAEEGAEVLDWKLDREGLLVTTD